MYDVLNIPLPAESHETEDLRKAIAEAEALGYDVAKKVASYSIEIAHIERAITVEKTRVLIKNSKDKVAIAEAKAEVAVADLTEELVKKEAELKFYKHVQGLISTRCSVGQSLLSNTTSQIKAGISSQTIL